MNDYEITQFSAKEKHVSHTALASASAITIPQVHPVGFTLV
jgi:hypothetical protein